MKRPISILVLGWLSIVAILVETPSILFKSPSLGDNGLTFSLLGQPLGPTYSVVTALLQVVGAVGILYGRAWARLVYVGEMVFATVVGVLNMSADQVRNSLPILVVFNIGIFFVLYRPYADAYFTRKLANNKSKRD